MIDIRQLTLSYEGKTVLRDFSLCIGAGEKICISGKSGCGKSSILNAILGFIPLQSGAIFYGDAMLSDTASILRFREHTAYLSQDISFPNQTVKELIDEPFRYKANQHKRPSTRQIYTVLAELNLEEEIYHKQLNELSGGQKQRVLLALIKLLDKPIVLLDEPTSALDRASVTVVAQFLRQMEDKIVVAVTHDSHFADFFQKTIHIGE